MASTTETAANAEEAASICPHASSFIIHLHHPAPPPQRVCSPPVLGSGALPALRAPLRTWSATAASKDLAQNSVLPRSFSGSGVWARPGWGSDSAVVAWGSCGGSRVAVVRPQPSQEVETGPQVLTGHGHAQVLVTWAHAWGGTCMAPASSEQASETQSEDRTPSPSERGPRLLTLTSAVMFCHFCSELCQRKAAGSGPQSGRGDSTDGQPGGSWGTLQTSACSPVC